MVLPENRSRKVGDDIHVSMDEVLSVLDEEELEEFEQVMALCQNILDDPTSFIGRDSLLAAAKLSVLRTKIGNRGQYYKTFKSYNEADKLIARKRKDLLLTMYTSLEENINTLKALGRIDTKMEGWH